MAMRTCAHCLSYVLHELGDLDRKRFERHLLGCMKCQQEVKELQALHTEAVSDFSCPVTRRPSLLFRPWQLPLVRLKAMVRVSLAGVVTAAAMASFTVLMPPNHGSDLFHDIQHTPARLRAVVGPLKGRLTRVHSTAVLDLTHLKQEFNRFPAHRV